MSQTNFNDKDQTKTKESHQNPRTRATTQSVVAQLRRSIDEGLYKHQDRLPAERLLAEQFNASRGTIRSALQQLEKQNLVKRSLGSGTFVNVSEEVDVESIIKITSPLEVIEVRIALEPHMMKQVVANASRNNLDSLADALNQVINCNNDPDRFTVSDTNFHIALAECSQNSLLLWLYRQISRVREYSQWRQVKDRVLTQQKIEQYNHEHKALYDAIVSRHADMAFDIMKSHLSGARDDLLGQ